jgi:hypothetical protein
MRRVQTFLMFLTVSSTLAPALAWAQPPVVSEPTSTARFTGASSGSGRGFGLGAAEVFNVPVGPLANILATWGDSGGRFHVDGLFGFSHRDTSNFDLGVRGWYHIHAASSADFSLGGGFGLISWKPSPGSRQTDFEMQIGAQVRAFIVSNVGLLASLGMAFYFPDSGSSTFAIGGDVTASLGIAYYFM